LIFFVTKEIFVAFHHIVWGDGLLYWT